jgi:hypothetical protein
MSIKAADAIYNTHLPKTSGGKLLANRAKPVNPNNEIHRFPASDRKFASVVILFILSFN